MFTPSFIATRSFAARRSRAWVSHAVTLQRKIRDCSQSIDYQGQRTLTGFKEDVLGLLRELFVKAKPQPGGGGGGVLPYLGYIGMCHPKGYGLWDSVYKSESLGRE